MRGCNLILNKIVCYWSGRMEKEENERRTQLNVHKGYIVFLICFDMLHVSIFYDLRYIL